ncbi:MAG TPA: hypothetical protein VK590_08045 [Saprospiraceae bacterium]|nr:hypothetical protein [Saprospiraceae bacterium]
MRILGLLVYCFLYHACETTNTNHTLTIQSPQVEAANTIKPIQGVSFVAPPRPFRDNPFTPLKEIGADWISVIPYGFCSTDKPIVRYSGKKQWWGERVEGICETIKLAHANNFKVMLKPQVFYHDGWPGSMEFKTEEDWLKWESSYEQFIIPFARIADSLNTEMFCIGTEFDKSTQQRNKFWIKLIEDIRIVYKGKITYAANWNEYEHIRFWDKLDFIGINAYFPLVNKTEPSIKNLLKSWDSSKGKMAQFSSQYNKQILFTEYGYLSVDRCAFNNWELEGRIEECKINQQAQANALEALYSSFYSESWWGGGFLWKWFPEMQGHEGYLERDYTPQGKKAELIVKKWFHSQTGQL